MPEEIAKFTDILDELGLDYEYYDDADWRLFDMGVEMYYEMARAEFPHLFQ